MSVNLWVESQAAKDASDYFNSLPREQKVRLIPLLEEYRRRGHLEAREKVANALGAMDDQRRRVSSLVTAAGEAADRERAPIESEAA